MGWALSRRNKRFCAIRLDCATIDALGPIHTHTCRVVILFRFQSPRPTPNPAPPHIQKPLHGTMSSFAILHGRSPTPLIRLGILTPGFGLLARPRMTPQRSGSSEGEGCIFRSPSPRLGSAAGRESAGQTPAITVFVHAEARVNIDPVLVMDLLDLCDMC